MKKILLILFLLLVTVSYAYATPTCIMNTFYETVGKDNSSLMYPSINCVADKNITRTNVTCDGSIIYNTTNLNLTTYVFNSSILVLQNQTRICSIYLNSSNGSFTNAFAVHYSYDPSDPTFTANSCPTALPQVILYLGILFFFLAIIIICLTMRTGIIGIFASVALIAYSLFITGCFAIFGLLFFGIGIGFFMHFAFGRYG